MCLDGIVSIKAKREGVHIWNLTKDDFQIYQKVTLCPNPFISMYSRASFRVFSPHR